VSAAETASPQPRPESGGDSRAEVLGELDARVADIRASVGPDVARGAALLAAEMRRGGPAPELREQARDATARTMPLGSIIGSTHAVLPRQKRTTPIPSTQAAWAALRLRYRSLLDTRALSSEQHAAPKVFIDECGSGRPDAFLRGKLLGIKPADRHQP
jgi:hypothetical protein